MDILLDLMFKSVGVILFFVVQGLLAQEAATWTEFGLKEGCTLRARAHLSDALQRQNAARFYLEFARGVRGSRSWDFTLDDSDRPGEHHQGVGNFSGGIVNHSTHMLRIRVTLYEYEVCDEEVSFKDLEMICLPRFPISAPKLVKLQTPYTMTTPSGISITLPVQDAYTFKRSFPVGFSFNGNASVVMFQMQRVPVQTEAVLPKSPLYKKHGKPVRIIIGHNQPAVFDFDQTGYNGYFYAGVNDVERLNRLESLKLTVRQRVDLQVVPSYFDVPLGNAR